MVESLQPGGASVCKVPGQISSPPEMSVWERLGQVRSMSVWENNGDSWASSNRRTRRWAASRRLRRGEPRLRRASLVLFCLSLLPGCALFRPAPRPAKVSPEEAARYSFPVVLPTEGQHVLPGRIAAAVAFAMEDFLPLGTKPRRDAVPTEVCASQRQSYDVTAVPGAGAVVFVSFSPRPDACQGLEGPPLADIPIVYAVDTDRWLILSVQM